MPAIHLMRWQAYCELEPFGELRDDYRFASIVQAMYNLQRDPKQHPSPFELSEFVIQFGEPEGGTKTRGQKSWQQMKMLAEALSMAHSKD